MSSSTVRGFPDWEVAPGQGRVTRPTLEIQRVRVGIDGHIKRLGFEFSVDPQAIDGTFVRDAYVQHRLSRSFRLRAGQFALGVRRDQGIRIDGRLGRIEYQTGLFAGDGVRRNDRSGVTSATRVVVNLPHDVELGGSWSLARTRARDEDAPNGPAFFSTSAFRFADGLYVEGRRTRLGAGVEWSSGRLRVSAEYLRLLDQRRGQGLDHEDLPTVVGSGVGAAVVYRVRTRRDPLTNAWLTALLRRPVDLALRYDVLAIDDTGAEGADSVRPRATNVRPRSMRALVIGATWNVSSWTRVLTNVTAERYSDSRPAPSAARAGTYLSMAARPQFEWP